MNKQQLSGSYSTLARTMILISLLCTLVGSAAPIVAQDNPIPLTYRNLTVKSFEINNNRNDAMRGVQVTIEPQRTDRYVRFPKQGTINGATGRRFSKIPPSNVVGPYTITAVSKDCGTQTRQFNKNGGSDQIVTFTFTKCGKNADPFAGGGYDVEVKLKESGGTRGNGYFVRAYDKSNRQVKNVRSSGNGQANLKGLQSEAAPFRIDVYRMNTKVTSYELARLDRDQSIDIDLDTANGGTNGGGSPTSGGGDRNYDLMVKVSTPLMVYLKDSYGKTVAKEEYSSRGVNFSDAAAAGGKYKVEFYFGNKKIASYDYSMPSRNSNVSYRLDR